MRLLGRIFHQGCGSFDASGGLCLAVRDGGGAGCQEQGLYRGGEPAVELRANRRGPSRFGSGLRCRSVAGEVGSAGAFTPGTFRLKFGGRVPGGPSPNTCFCASPIFLYSSRSLSAAVSPASRPIGCASESVADSHPEQEKRANPQVALRESPDAPDRRMTSTSSGAASVPEGSTVMSWKFVPSRTLVTFPTGSPFGKTRSSPEVKNISPFSLSVRVGRSPPARCWFPSPSERRARDSSAIPLPPRSPDR